MLMHTHLPSQGKQTKSGYFSMNFCFVRICLGREASLIPTQPGFVVMILAQLSEICTDSSVDSLIRFITTALGPPSGLSADRFPHRSSVFRSFSFSFLERWGLLVEGETVAAGEGETVAAGEGETVAAGEGETVAAGEGETVAAGEGETVVAGGGETVASEYGVGAARKPSCPLSSESEYS